MRNITVVKLKFEQKFDAKINSTLIFLQIVSKLLIYFSKESVSFLLYLLADKGNYLPKVILKCIYILFLGHVIAATGTLSYSTWKKKEVPIEVFDLADTSVTCKNLTKITARYGSTGGFVQNKILICGGWGYYQLPLYVF